jgi:sterol desaturase/sphingolipid hydroxylase (fatty acid hydroxylase superfamily)
MEQLLSFFEALTTVQKLIWIFICLIFFWTLELIIPLVKHNYSKLKHDGINLVFFSFLMVINVVIGIITVGVFYWIDQAQFGVLNWVQLPVWVELTIALIALDFVSQYLAHYMLHRVKWMWKLHMVHHSDTKVDATTGTRQHPVEYILREGFAITTIIIFGMPVAYYLLYRMVTIFFTYWTHANIELPGWLDKTLSLVIITPNAHKFHHHFERPWTDTNFGNVLSIWDRMFGTFVYENPKDIKYGLDVVDESKDENIGYQLGLPLNKNIKTDY